MALNTDDLNFLQLISTFRRGELMDDCNLKLSELMEAIANTGKGGKLNLTLDFKIAKGGHLEVTATPKISKPVTAIPPASTGTMTIRIPKSVSPAPMSTASPSSSAPPKSSAAGAHS